MKFCSVLVLTLFLKSVYAQSIDSIAFKSLDSLIKVSRGYTDKNDFVNAIEMNTVAEKHALEKWGHESAGYAAACLNRGRIFQIKKDYSEAEKWYFESQAIYEKVLGKENAQYAGTQSKLGSLYYSMGKFKQAIEYNIKAKLIFEKVLGKEDPQYVEILLNLAILYKNIGEFENAETLYLEVKAIREKVLGKKHPDYAQCLSSLGNLYTLIGQYEKAEPLLLESKIIQENTTGKQNPGFCGTLINLANLYDRMSNSEKTEQYLLEAKGIFEQQLNNREHPFYVNCLNNLGVFYIDQGSYEKAEAYCLQVKSIFEKKYGKEHPNYAGSINNLAKLYKYMGQFEKAEPLYIESIAIKEKTFGKDHPAYARSLLNLGSLYYSMGHYAKVEQLYIEAKTIFENVFSKKHADYTSSLIHLVDLYEIQKRYTESNIALEEFFSLSQDQLLKSVSFLSESELASYTAAFQKEGNYLYSYMFTRLFSAEQYQSDMLAAIAYNNSIFLKGFLLSAVAKMNSLARSSPEAEKISTQLKSYRLSLATEYAKPLAEQKKVAELEEQANLTEKKLAQSVLSYADVIQQVKWEEVRAILNPNDVAIEFIHFPIIFPRMTDSIYYAALLITSEDKQPQFVLLFEEKSLDSLLHSKSERKADYVNSLYSLEDRGAVAVEAPKRSLYDILWKPLEKKLNGVKTIYFSPSGLLHRINFDAIPVSDSIGADPIRIGSETLSDRYQFIELNSTRQLVMHGQTNSTNNDAVLYGGIQFEQDTSVLKEELLLASRSRGERTFTIADSTLRGAGWNYLSGTEREVNSIEKIMQDAGVKTTLKKGYSASEGSFKNIGANNSPSPRILHIATHGYFFPDPKIKGKQSADNSQTESAFNMSDHPMLRSGLILAGGNAAWQGKQTLEGREDGILTAYEISQMNLSNTELVVLSACETGLGDIQGNEGVYGLQRAFKIAGAKYLIMSLWQVPDKQTSLLMTTFYKKWLENKMSIPNAFHAAQKELRDAGMDPYQWAGFVLVE